MEGYSELIQKRFLVVVRLPKPDKRIDEAEDK